MTEFLSPFLFRGKAAEFGIAGAPELTIDLLNLLGDLDTTAGAVLSGSTRSVASATAPRLSVCVPRYLHNASLFFFADNVLTIVVIVRWLSI